MTQYSIGRGSRKSEEAAMGFETQRLRRQVEESPPLFGLGEQVGDGPELSGVSGGLSQSQGRIVPAADEMINSGGMTSKSNIRNVQSRNSRIRIDNEARRRFNL